MDFSHYSSDIQTIIANIANNRRIDSRLVLEYCRQLLRFARKTNDSALYGYAYYYMSESYFSFHNYSIFLNYLIKGITHQQKANQESLLARSYNLLAISADNQGNLASALDYYLTSLRYCKPADLKYEAGLVYTNIGYLYLYLKEYATAIHYFRSGLDYISQEKEDPFYPTNLALSLILIGNCHYNLGHIETALEYEAECLEKCCFKELPPYVKVAYDCFGIKLLTATNRLQERDQKIREAIPYMTSISSLLDIYSEIFDFCDHLFSIKKYEELWKVVHHLEELTGASDITNLQLKVLKFKVEYYKLFDDEINYLKATSQYFELSEKLRIDDNSITLSTINLRFSLEEARLRNHQMEKENRLLQERSERDSLTGLPNRYRLNEYSEEVFERAFANQTALAVEIFDVDYFKQFNDTYGHQAGDECLSRISQFLKEIMSEDIFCARYGGDEFIIIYENKTDEEILRIATYLKESVENLQIEHKNSKTASSVTISQGIRNSVPASTNKMWDFLFAADAALYQVKRTKKNDILLVHKTTSQKAVSYQNAEASLIQYTNS